MNPEQTEQTTRHDDPVNLGILARRRALLDALPGPRVGDFLLRDDGSYDRFTYDWTEANGRIQAGGAGGSFYLGQGFVSYSGGLDHGVRAADLEPRGEREGEVWFFDRDHPRAGGGVSYRIPFRVFAVRAVPS